MLSSGEKMEIYQGRVCMSSSTADEKQPKSGVGSSSKTKSSLKPKNKQSVPTESKTNEDSEVDSKKKCLMELATASTNLVLAYMDFGKKHEAAVKLFPNNEKIKKLKEDALLICDEQKIHSEFRNEGEGLSFSQDEEYWQDPAVIEAWDRFSKVSGTEKPPESAVIHSNVHVAGDQLPELAAVNVSQIASEALAMASDIIDIELVGGGSGGAYVAPDPIVGPLFSIRVTRSSTSGGPSFSLGINSSQSEEEIEPMAAKVLNKRKADDDDEVLKKKKRSKHVSYVFRSPFKCQAVNFQTPLTK